MEISAFSIELIGHPFICIFYPQFASLHLRDYCCSIWICMSDTNPLFTSQFFPMYKILRIEQYNIVRQLSNIQSLQSNSQALCQYMDTRLIVGMTPCDASVTLGVATFLSQYLIYVGTNIYKNLSLTCTKNRTQNYKIISLYKTASLRT